MRQNIRNAEYRIFRIFPNTHLHHATVFLAYYTVNRKRQCKPLIFFYAAVIMCIQIYQKFLFIQRILLYIKTRRINVSTKNIQAVFDWLRTNVKQGDSFSKLCYKNLIASTERLSFIYILIAVFFRKLNN